MPEMLAERDPEIHFLAGMSRAGITWLSRALNQHPEIAVFGQSRFWGKHFVEPDADGLYREAQLARLGGKIQAFEWNATVGDGPGCLAGLSLHDFQNLLLNALDEIDQPQSPAAVFTAMSRAVAAHSGARVVIEKTPHHVLYADRIQAAFPDAQLLLLQCTAEQHMAVLKAQPDLRYHPLAAAIIWRRYSRAIRQQCEVRAGSTATIDAASLCDAPAETLARIGTLLGVAEFDWARQMPDFDFGVTGGVLPELDAADEFWKHRINGLAATSAAAEHGDSVLASLVGLPGYIAHNLKVSHDEVEGSLVAYYRRWLAGIGR